MKNKILLPLVARLRACPSHDQTLSRELFLESWGLLVREDVMPFTKPTRPVMAALLLHDDEFAGLLNEAESLQLTALVQLALDRYEQQTNPSNKLGKLLAGSLKKE